MNKQVALVGATGLVGRELLCLLEGREFPVARLALFGSPRQPDRRLLFRSEPLPVRPLSPGCFRGIELAFFATPAAVAETWVPEARGAGSLVIDHSSAYRSDPEVPLVVPEVNGETLSNHQGLVANPNCSTILLVLVLAPLHRMASLRQVVVATYQAVSGAGQAAVLELEKQLLDRRTPRRAPRRDHGEARPAEEPIGGVFEQEIALNLIPAIGPGQPSQFTGEERKIQDESRRILNLGNLAISATCVRVPVLRVHSEAVHVGLSRPVSIERVRRELSRAPGLSVLDDPALGLYPTPRRAEGLDQVLVGRIRQDPALDPGVALFLSGDQLRKGAALNAVQIAEMAFA